MALGRPVTSLGVRTNSPLDPSDFGVWLASRGIWLERIAEAAEPEGGCLYLVDSRADNVNHCRLRDTRKKDLCFDPEADSAEERVFKQKEDSIVKVYWRLWDQGSKRHQFIQWPTE
jgi:hypothetical protein